MKKSPFLSSLEADALSRRLTTERLKQAGVKLDKVLIDPDFKPLAESVKAASKKRSKTKSPSPFSAKILKKLAGY